MNLEDDFDQEMDLLWDSMPFGMRGRDLRSNTLPRSFNLMPRSSMSVAGQPKSRRSLASFPRYGMSSGRDRRTDDYKPVSFHDDVFPSFRNRNDDIAHRINIHHDNGRPRMSNDDSKYSSVF